LKVLLVTSVSARKLLEEVLKEVKTGDFILDVVVLDVPVASLATVNDVVKTLHKYKSKLSGYDLIILPGLVRGNAKRVEEEFNVKAIKGTKYVGDLPELLKLVRLGFEFSYETPADELIQEYLSKTYYDKVVNAIETKAPLFTVKNVKFTKTPPPLNLFFEYLMNEHNSLNEFNNLLSELRVSKYEGVVVGCNVECQNYDEVMKYVNLALNERLVVGIDVPIDLTKVDIVKDLLRLPDMIFNVTSKDLDVLTKYLSSEQVVVVVPSKEGLKDVEEEINEIIYKLNEVGINKVLIDPVVKPPMLGFYESLIRYSTLNAKTPYPLLIGFSNVYELLDVDSHGVLVLLSSIAFELGISSVLITESSVKAGGALKEASISREMIYRAYVKKSPPINVGIDLLIVKDKRKLTVKPPKVEEGRITYVTDVIPPKMEASYYLKIYVDHEEGNIIVDVVSRESDEVLKRYVGKNPLSIGRKLLRDYMLSAEHVLYLGYELSKAETSLKLRKNYVQDEDLFKFSYA